HLFETAPRVEGSPYVCPSILDPNLPMSKPTYYDGWRRILTRAGLAPVGTHGIRHRAATDIANSGIPLKIGMVVHSENHICDIDSHGFVESGRLVSDDFAF